jgi:hypothetical protein
MRLSEPDVRVGLMQYCPVCYERLPEDYRCCGWYWKDPEIKRCNYKLDFLTKYNDRKEKNESYSYFSSLTSPVKHWAFLFGKNK